MAEKIVTVKSKQTGIEHTVLESHWSVTSDEFEVMPQKVAKKATRKKAAPKKKAE